MENKILQKQRGSLLVKISLAVIALLILAVAGFAINYLRPSKRLLRHYEKGRLYFNQTKFSLAIKEFKEALTIDPKNSDIHYQMANTYLLNEEKDIAVEELEKIIVYAPEFTKPYELLIEIYNRDAVTTEKKEDKDAKFRKSLNHCDKLIQLQPNNIKYWNIRARTLFAMGETKKAESDLEKAIHISSRESESYISLSQIYLLTNRTKEGLEILEKYLKEINSQDLDARLALGNDYLNLRDYKSALKHLQYAYENKPDEFMKTGPSYALALLGDNQIEKAVLLAEKGIAELKSIATKGARTPNAIRLEVAFTYVLGSGQFAQRKFKDAIQNLLKVKNQLPQFLDIAYKLAISYIETGTNQLAIEVLREGIKKSPNAILLRTTLVQTLASINEWEKAEKECEELLQIDPDSIEIRRLKARILLAQAKDDKAKEVYKEISNLAPKSPEGQIGLALIEIERNKFQEALPILQKLEKENPKQAPVNFLLAQCMVGLNNLESGLEYINRSLEIEPNFPAARILLGRIRMYQGALNLAAKELESLQKAYPQNLQILLELVFLYLRMGQPDKSMELITKAGLDKVNNPIFQEAIARIHFVKKEYDQALKTINSIPNHNASHKMLLGNIYNRLERYEDSLDSYKKANLIDPNVQINIPMAISHYLHKNWKSAAECLQQHLVNAPEDNVVRILRANILVMDNRLDEALKEIQHTLQKDSNTKWLSKLMLSGIYVAKKNFDKAKKEIDEIPDDFPYLKDFQGLINYCEKNNLHFNPLLDAIILRETGNRDESLVKCEEAVKLLNSHPVSLYIYGMTLVDMEREDQRTKGKEVLGKMIEAANVPIYLYTSLARIYTRDNEFENAEKCYKKALSIRPEATDLALALGMLYESNKKIDLAIEHYKKILKATEEDKQKMAGLRAIALNNLGWLCLEESSKRDIKFALECAKEAFDNAGFNWAIADTLGWAYYYNDDYKNAERYLVYAKNLKPDYPTIYYHLAKVYLKQNNKEAAKENFKKALELAKDTKQEFRESKEATELLEVLSKEK